MAHKTVMIGDKRYHLPFIDLIPFDHEQNQALKAELHEAGEVLVPIIANKEKSKPNDVWVTDGAHRAEHASTLHLDPPPVKFRSFADDEEERDFVLRVNLHRRHLSPQQLEHERRKRVERVAELKKQGMSNPAIAEQLGVDESTVRRDLKKAVSAGAETEPEGGEITTKDGKKRSPKLIICKRCKRLGKPVANCKQCEAAKKESVKKKVAAKRKQEAAVEAEQKVDCFKAPVPAKRCDALFDPWIQTSIDLLAQTSATFREARLGEVIQKKGKHYPFLDPKEFADGCGFVIQYLDDLIDHLKINRPEAVCPMCNGDGCGACRMSGLVPRNVHATIKEAGSDTAVA